MLARELLCETTMIDSMPPFDDPALKQAVRGAWGKVQAPATFGSALRGKLAASPETIPEHSTHSTSPIPIQSGVTYGRPRMAFMPLAAAAVILLAVGAIFWVVASNSAPDPFPGDWASELVARHDSCSSLPDHHYVVGVAPDDIAGARNRLANQLGFPVLSMSADNGWQFRGAGPCPVGPGPTAHFLYRRGDTTLSVFSLNVPTLSGDTGELASEVNGHQLAGFVRGSTLYCVVESDPSQSISPADVRSMIDQLQDQFSNPTPSGSGAATATNTTHAADTTPIALDAPDDFAPSSSMASRDVASAVVP